VRELLLCARAIDDPTDELAVVSTLRSPLFGCTGVELWRWRAGGGRWFWAAHHAEAPAPAGPVADGLRQLDQWSRQRSRTSPGELLADIIEARRVLETVTDTPRYRETWRRLRFVVDQARAWSESERGSLREYLAWAARQAEDTARVAETVLPETDADAARITTIHASKGLQFPVVILAGLSARPITQRPPVLWPVDGGCEIRLGAQQPTLGYAAVVTRASPARMTLLAADSAARTRSACESRAISVASPAQRTPFAREPSLPRMTAAACLGSGRA
jgi:ATP-dependent helicase/nuclease subunit A